MPTSHKRDLPPKLYTFTVGNTTDTKSLCRRGSGVNIHSKSVYQGFFPENAQWHFIQKALHPQTPRPGAASRTLPSEYLSLFTSFIGHLYVFSPKNEFLCILQLEVDYRELPSPHLGCMRAGSASPRGGHSAGTEAGAFPSLREVAGSAHRARLGKSVNIFSGGPGGRFLWRCPNTKSNSFRNSKEFSSPSKPEALLQTQLEAVVLVLEEQTSNCVRRMPCLGPSSGRGGATPGLPLLCVEALLLT